MSKKFTFDEIKDLVLNFHIIDGTNSEKQMMMEAMLRQLGFEVKGCNCTSQTSTLYTKLSEWLKRHPEGFCKYELVTDRLLFDADRHAITKLNFNNKRAEYLLSNPETAKYVKLIDTEDKNDSNVESDTEDISSPADLAEQIEATEAKMTGKRKVKENKRKTTK